MLSAEDEDEMQEGGQTKYKKRKDAAKRGRKPDSGDYDNTDDMQESDEDIDEEKEKIHTQSKKKKQNINCCVIYIIVT